ncbi:TPA: DUF551 domain-containing protein [Klebsiella pneumoniae]
MTSKFTREELLNIINTDHVQCGEASALARMALAAMESEPVAWTWHYREQWHVTNDERRAEFVAKDGDVAVLPLYRHAQPAPVGNEFIPKNLDRALGVLGMALPESKEEFNLQSERWIQRLIDRVIRYADEFKVQPAPVVPNSISVREAIYALESADAVTTIGQAYKMGWNHCRATMLQPQSDDDGEPTDDERIMAIEGIHSCERCGDEGWVVGEMGITRCACNQGNPVFKIDLNSDFIKHVKAVSEKVRAANSPVIPDGSMAMLRRWLEFGRGMQNAGSQLPHNLIAETEAMLAAAPQLPGSEPAAVPGKWIPVSERLPEAGGDMIVFTDGIVMSGVSYAKKKGFYIQALEYDDDEPVDSVTHWMPLPPPPTEVK